MAPIYGTLMKNEFKKIKLNKKKPFIYKDFLRYNLGVRGFRDRPLLSDRLGVRATSGTPVGN